MNTFHRRFAAVAALALASAGAQAATVTLAGAIVSHNDIVNVDFTLAAASAVKIWSDSWQSGLNFDPTAAVWSPAGSDYSLLLAVDDDDTVAPGQGFYDTGFTFPTLAAGSYRLTLATAINSPLGTLLSQGFAYDLEAPIALGLWNQPTYDPNANDQKGGAWRLTFDGVDQAAVTVQAVREPASLLLVGFALGLVALTSHRRRSQKAQQAAFAAGPAVDVAVPSAMQRNRWPAMVDVVL